MTDTEACVYFQQPGHVPEQKPDPHTAYAAGPDSWPMCGPCAAVAEVPATLTMAPSSPGAGRPKPSRSPCSRPM